MPAWIASAEPCPWEQQRSDVIDTRKLHTILAILTRRNRAGRLLFVPQNLNLKL